MSKPQESKTKKYGTGSFSITITLLLMVIFGIIGAIVGGWVGLGVGIIMPLIASLMSYAGLIPFAGVWLYMLGFNYFFDWLYSVVPSMGSFLAQDALPRIILFWVFLIMSAIATVVMSIVILFLIAVAVKALTD